MTLIAEDLLLLLLDDESGKPQTSQLDTALGGALLVELALAGAVTVSTETKPSIWKQAKVRAEPGVRWTTSSSPRRCATIGERERSAQDLVVRLGKGLDDNLCSRLAERGMLERRDDKVLGLFPRTRWPARDCAHEEDVRRAAHRRARRRGPSPSRASVRWSPCCTPSTARTRPCRTTGCPAAR